MHGTATHTQKWFLFIPIMTYFKTNIVQSSFQSISKTLTGRKMKKWDGTIPVKRWNQRKLCQFSHARFLFSFFFSVLKQIRHVYDPQQHVIVAGKRVAHHKICRPWHTICITFIWYQQEYLISSPTIDRCLSLHLASPIHMHCFAPSQFVGLAKDILKPFPARTRIG